MKKFKNILAVAAMALLFSSCATTYPGYVTDNGGSKVGEASATFLFGRYPLKGGDYSIKKACEEGNISKVASVDTKISGGTFKTKITTIVVGE